MIPCWTALKYFQYPAGRFILLRPLSLSLSLSRFLSFFLSLSSASFACVLLLLLLLLLLLRFAVASLQSSFMPPGGEDLITRGEWIPHASFSSQPEFLLLSHTRSARVIQRVFCSNFSFSFFLPLLFSFFLFSFFFWKLPSHGSPVVH